MYRYLLALLLVIVAQQPVWAGQKHHNGYDDYYEHYDRSELVDAADRLVRRAKKLQKTLRRETGYAAISFQARDLLHASRALREDIKYDIPTRKLRRRLRELSNCLYELKDNFYSHDYEYLSHKAEKRLHKTVAALDRLERKVSAIPQQYSYHYEPRAYGSREYDRRR